MGAKRKIGVLSLLVVIVLEAMNPKKRGRSKAQTGDIQAAGWRERQQKGLLKKIGSPRKKTKCVKGLLDH